VHYGISYCFIYTLLSGTDDDDDEEEEEKEFRSSCVWMFFLSAGKHDRTESEAQREKN
jgi:hypothetical protein